MRPIAFVMTMVMLAGTATAQTARRPTGGKVADGVYSCQMWLGSSYVSLGKVRVASGKLEPNPVAKAGGTVTGITPAADGMTVAYTTKRGYAETLDCKRG